MAVPACAVSLTAVAKGGKQGTRELIFHGLPYIVVYRVKNENVEVARIYHGAQDWP